MKNNLKRICLFILTFALILFPKTAYAKVYDFSAYPEMGVVIYETNTGDTIVSNHPDERYYPGSITKLLTALIVLDYSNLTDELTVTKEELDMVEPYSSVADLVAGETLTVEQLIYALMLPSGNDASKVLAVNTGKKILANDQATNSDAYNAFIRQMNLKAKLIGMKNSNFSNSDGYDDENNYSTPSDMIILGREALKSEIIRKTASTRYKSVKTNLAQHNWYSTDVFLYENFDGAPDLASGLSGRNPYYDTRVTGLKTGFTDMGGRCFLLTASSNGMDIVGIVMRVPDSKNKIWDRTLALIKFVYDNYTYTKLINDENRNYAYKVSNHAFLINSALTLSAQQDSAACVDNTLLEGITMNITPNPEKAELKENGKLKLLSDIKAGDEVAYATFVNGDTIIKTVPFIATSNYRKMGIIDVLLYALSLFLILLVVWKAVKVADKNNKTRRKRNERKTF